MCKSNGPMPGWGRGANTRTLVKYSDKNKIMIKRGGGTTTDKNTQHQQSNR
jgi:hypothetical protein